MRCWESPENLMYTRSDTRAAGCLQYATDRWSAYLSISYFFFFQAEDGIRDVAVTGVQTCALPIFGKVLEFAGEDLMNWPMDERATLTNMAVEAGGFTGIIEPDEATLAYIVTTRGVDADEVRKGFVFSDPDAEYAAVFEIDLNEIRPMVALPGDPRNGIPIDALDGEVRIDAAY